MGKLVAVEGPDLVGKTTLVLHLDLQLRERGFSTEHFRFPPEDRSAETDLLYDVMMRTRDPLEQQLALVQIFNAYGPKILAALRTHDIVIIDRYMLSVLVACRALDLDLTRIHEALRSAIIPPDVTIIYTGRPFHTPRDDDEHRARFRGEVQRIFEADLPEYRHPVVRVTNEAAHMGKSREFVSHLADQMLGRLRMPWRKPDAGPAQGSAIPS